MSESTIKQACLKYAKRNGAEAYFTNGVNGMCDLLIVMDDHCMLVEGKLYDGSVRKIQELAHKRLRKAGNTVYITYTLEHFKYEFDKWKVKIKS